MSNEEPDEGSEKNDELRICHRDIKPHNILLSQSEIPPQSFFSRPKISDMGLGKQLDFTQSSFGAVSFSSMKDHDHSSTSSAQSGGAPPASVGW